jgi:hypothetical protein
VDELVTAMNVALGSGAATQCPAADVDRNGRLDIDELVVAVGRSLAGCFRSEGGGAVEDAVRVAVTNASAIPRFQVLDFGSLAASAAPSSTRWAGYVAHSEGASGQVPVELACDVGTRRVLCRQNGEGSSTRETEYLSCQLTEGELVVIRNGLERFSVSAPGCPARVPAGANNFGHNLSRRGFQRVSRAL